VKADHVEVGVDRLSGHLFSPLQLPRNLHKVLLVREDAVGGD
jgi:hypothetical protein